MPFPSPGYLPDLGIKPMSLALQADSLPTEPPGKPFGKQERIQIMKNFCVVNEMVFTLVTSTEHLNSSGREREYAPRGGMLGGLILDFCRLIPFPRNIFEKVPWAKVILGPIFQLKCRGHSGTLRNTFFWVSSHPQITPFGRNAEETCQSFSVERGSHLHRSTHQL